MENDNKFSVKDPLLTIEERILFREANNTVYSFANNIQIDIDRHVYYPTVEKYYTKSLAIGYLESIEEEIIEVLNVIKNKKDRIKNGSLIPLDIEE